MKKAFSLAELVIVLAIISIIMGTMKIHIRHKRIQAEAKRIVECVKIYEAALTMYYLRHGGTFPDNASGKNLENVSELAAYCPSGFNTHNSIGANFIEDIRIYDKDGAYGIEIFSQSSESNEVLAEVEKQLKNFTTEDQTLQYTEYEAIFDNDGTQIDQSPSSTCLVFLLKKDNDIYI